MAPRRKAARIEAPQTIEEATRLIAEYLEFGAEVDRTRAGADDAIRQIEAIRDERCAPVEARMKDVFMQLRTWWAVARADLTDGKRKSIELAGAVLGDRITPPALQLPKGKNAADIVSELLEELGGDFLVTTSKLDKQAIIKALRSSFEPDNPDHRLAIYQQHILREQLRLAAVQREEFFIDRAARAEPDPVIEVPAEEALS